MTQKELAHALGITPGMLSKLKKRGMPVDSLERAQRWRKRHLEPGRVKGSRFDPNAPVAKTSAAGPATRYATPSASEVKYLELLARAADADLAHEAPELIDLEPLRECLRAWPSSSPVPPMSVRTWIALVDHAMALDAAVRHHADQGQRVTPEEFHHLICPGQGGGRHWVVTAGDSLAIRTAMLAYDAALDSAEGTNSLDEGPSPIGP